MKALIQFEMKKVFRSTFFRLMMLVFCLFLLAYYIYVYANTTRAGEVMLEHEDRIHPEEQFLQEMKDLIDSGEVIPDKMMKLDMEISQGHLDREKAELEALTDRDWTTYLSLDIDYNEPMIQSLLTKREYYTSEWPTLFTQETRIEQNKLMRDQEIVPILPINFFSWMTAYDVVFDEAGMDIMETFLKKNTRKYSSVGIYYLKDVFGLLFSVFGAGFFLFLFGDVLTKEGLGRNGPIHLLHTQPIQRNKIMVSKFLTVLFISISIIVGTVIFSLLLGTIFDRFGDWNYPVLIYGEDYAYEFMNMSTYMMKSAALFFMILLFCYSLLFLFSILTRKALIALGLTVVTLFMGIKLSEEAVLSNLSPYIPFHYFSAPKVVTMELAASLKNFDFNLINGVIVLGISSLALLVLTYVSTVLQNKFSR